MIRQVFRNRPNRCPTAHDGYRDPSPRLKAAGGFGISEKPYFRKKVSYCAGMTAMLET
jgi:hypothetical protein